MLHSRKKYHNTPIFSQMTTREQLAYIKRKITNFIPEVPNERSLLFQATSEAEKAYKKSSRYFIAEMSLGSITAACGLALFCFFPNSKDSSFWSKVLVTTSLVNFVSSAFSHMRQNKAKSGIRIFAMNARQNFPEPKEAAEETLRVIKQIS